MHPTVNQVEVQKLYQVFHQVATENNTVGLPQFRKGLQMLEQSGFKPRDGSIAFADRLFSLLDLNHVCTIGSWPSLTSMDVLMRLID